MLDPGLALVDPDRVLWHVTLLVAGEAQCPSDVRAALARLSDEHPFLLSARYTGQRAELRYWEEAACLDDAAALALRLWGEHRSSAGLPPWSVVGLEVLDRASFHWKAEQGERPQVLVSAGGIRPF